MGKLLLAVATLALIGCGGLDESDDASDLAAQTAAPEACGKDTWKNYAGKFFETKCASCHAATFTSAAAVDASGARAQISAGKMPRDKALPAAQKKRILSWFACGSP